MTGKSDPFGDIEQLVEDFVTMRPSVGQRPPVDVVETDEEVRVFVDLPGRDSDDIDVTLEEGRRLTVTAAAVDTEIEGRYVTSERSQDELSRSMTLPTTVDETETQASYDSGVLAITLLKQREDSGTEIPVE